MFCSSDPINSMLFMASESALRLRAQLYANQGPSVSSSRRLVTFVHR